MRISAGWLQGVRQVRTPFFNSRPNPLDISLIVIHNISLPPNQFIGPSPYIDALFTGTLNPKDHPYFEGIYKMEVSTHLFINRAGEITQYVSFLDRAWHAGRSSWNGKKECNDYAIGIELEGSDFEPYTNIQYEVLNQVIKVLKETYQDIKEVVGHSDVAPTRKTDPGPFFEWERIGVKK